MTLIPYWQDEFLTLWAGDCREVLAQLPERSVQCVVTSPPYWALRDYGIEGQLGLEDTPEQFIEAMVQVFREVRRVLRDDGTLWLNIGDTYGGAMAGRAGVKSKDLVGIPWMLAMALRADGWFLRSDVIWSKPNPMPEPVTDRPVKSHEYVFLLTKSERYYFDAEAVRLTPPPGADNREGPVKQPPMPLHGKHVLAEGHRDRVERLPALVKGASIRTVWTIPTEPYPGAHFATFPRALVEPCIKAGTPEWGCCAECGAPWARDVEVGYVGDGSNASDLRKSQGALGSAYYSRWMRRVSRTLGWNSSCGHGGRPVPAVVLDPFAGSGTTLLVAQQLSRRGWGVDASPQYLAQALRRNAQLPLGLA